MKIKDSTNRPAWTQDDLHAYKHLRRPGHEIVKDYFVKTKGLINKGLLSKAQKPLIIVNTSRALIVNQNDLLDGLKKGSVKAYLTDVLEEEPMIKDHPLLQFDNVIITPHIGSRTYESVQRQGMKAVENLFNALNIQ